MKKYLFFLFLLPALAFVSCDDDDGYSLDDFWVSLGTVENPDKEPYFFLHLDNGETIWFGATNYLNYRPVTGQRILADYTLLNDKPEGSSYDHDAKLNDAYDILTKGIITVSPSMQDSIGNDPIHVRDQWIGTDYLNIRFTYKSENKRHMVNLVSDTSKVYNDGKTHLEFRHNAFGDGQALTAGGIVSFNLSTLKQGATDGSLPLVIHFKNLNGQEETKEVTYKFDGSGSEDKELNRESFNEGKGLEIS